MRRAYQSPRRPRTSIPTVARSSSSWQPTPRYFPTANANAARSRPFAELTMLSNSQITPVFDATVEATEEAIINALIAAETMVGRDGNRSEALDHDRLRAILERYNRLVQ